MTPPEVRGANVADAWRKAARTLLEHGDSFHLVVRVGTAPDDDDVRLRVDGLLASRRLQPVETVANTLFPASLAATAPDPADLTARYRSLYPRIKKHPRNRRGTYFGRLVDYPEGDSVTSNQLVHTVAKLKQELIVGHKSSRYECAIYSPAADSKVTMAFPCLSFIAFHLDARRERLHLSAQYRNQYIVARGYGNYLALARLRDYVARAVGMQPGEMAVLAGHASVDGGCRQALAQLLDDLDRTKGPP